MYVDTVVDSWCFLYRSAAPPPSAEKAKMDSEVRFGACGSDMKAIFVVVI